MTEKLQVTLQTLVVQEPEKRWLCFDSTDHAGNRWGGDCIAYITSPPQATIALKMLHYFLKNIWQSTLICLFLLQTGEPGIQRTPELRVPSVLPSSWRNLWHGTFKLLCQFLTLLSQKFSFPIFYIYLHSMGTVVKRSMNNDGCKCPASHHSIQILIFFLSYKEATTTTLRQLTYIFLDFLSSLLTVIWVMLPLTELQTAGTFQRTPGVLSQNSTTFTNYLQWLDPCHLKKKFSC